MKKELGDRLSDAEKKADEGDRALRDEIRGKIRKTYCQ